VSYSFGVVARTFGAAVGVLLTVLFLADIAGRLSTPEPTSSAPTRTAARR
jgi:hypothetical protein